MRPAARITALAAALAAAAATRVPAQEFLDRGTFVIERGGIEVGREEFAIRRAGGSVGAPTRASAEKGQRIFEYIKERIRTRVLGVAAAPAEA